MKSAKLYIQAQELFNLLFEGYPDMEMENSKGQIYEKQNYSKVIQVYATIFKDQDSLQLQVRIKVLQSLQKNMILIIIKQQSFPKGINNNYNIQSQNQISQMVYIHCKGARKVN
ncbi:hypothetical protein pb186bvf_020299 [Paramecium bursaria]